jgi:uncharacterized protein YjiS (DUF1127 family)
MAYSLTSERPGVAAATFNPIRALARWINDARVKHAQRVALSNLLELDASLLYDLGIDRSDVVEALRAPYRRAGDHLAARRARSARDWHAHP